MIRQAQSYFAGAASSAALIAAAIVGFVLLVWLSPSGLRLPDLGGGSDTVAPVSAGRLPADLDARALGVRIRRGRSGSSGAAARAGGERGQAGPGSPGGPQAQQQAGGGGGAGGIGGPAAGGGNGNAAVPGAGGGTPGLHVGGTTVNSQSVTDTVGGVVDTVDQATGGALDQTGVAGAVHGVTESAAGPASPVGQTVDQTVSTVDGMVGGPR